MRGGVLAAFVAAILAATPASAQVDRFRGKIVIGSAAGDAVTVNGGLVVGSLTDPSGQALDVRSTADDLSSGIRISRADANNSYLIANINSGSTFATLQAGNGIANLPIRVSPNGGGLSVGAGAAFLKVLSASTTWDPGNLQVDDGADSITLSLPGVTSTSPCFVAFSAALGLNVVMTARYDSADIVRAILVNTNTGLAYDPGSGTVRVTCFVY